jgi:hypothetical protein
LNRTFFVKRTSKAKDKYNNSRIVCGTQQDINRSEKVIDRLDILLEQVRIEVAIAQGTLTDNETSALESLGISHVGDIPTTSLSQIPNPAGLHCVAFVGHGSSNGSLKNGFIPF